MAVVTSKGGGGKTTLTTCLAVSLVERGFRVSVIDADRNATFSDWHRANYEGPALTSTLAFSGWVACGFGEAVEECARDCCHVPVRR